MIELFSSVNQVSSLLFWGILLITIAIYFGVMESNKKEKAFQKVFKAINVVLLIWGILLLIGAAKGHQSFWLPLKSNTAMEHTTTASQQTPLFTEIYNMGDLKKKQTEAIALQKPLLIYFYSSYCSLCNKLNEITYKEAKIIKSLSENYVAVKINVADKSDKKMLEMKKHFNILGTPAFVFFDAEGEKIDDNVLYGYQGVEEFYDTLDLMAE
ncbi:MAG: Cytochrome C biogenesis protein [uncultured Sulfurovum sp.]|uniref:Cytochrome C biogenesis protein n=1 Tax=uncultured Sulfurovum sp. TaxID=269237 RepID=A0A6S6SDA4_9BACT|nr:MAG: Cytochrome C biogenesis protein [uncultured Sulfurovum sp.]